MKFSVSPIVRVAVEPKVASELPKLVNGAFFSFHIGKAARLSVWAKQRPLSKLAQATGVHPDSEAAAVPSAGAPQAV